MKTSKLAIRVPALLLALASSACAQNKTPEADPIGQTQQTPVEPNTPPDKPQPLPGGAPPKAGGGSGHSSSKSRSVAVSSAMGEFQKNYAKGQAMRGAMMFRSGSSDTPVVLVTQPTEPAIQSEWDEDLKVMDKLLRDAIDGNGDPSAMGIPLVMLGRAAPMYVEGCGVIFRTGVSWSLAAADKDAGKQDGKQRDRTSAWERAKRQVSGEVPGNAPEFLDMPMYPPFQQEKLDALIAGMIRVLPEASNMRHLKPEEFVFISVSGTDDNGAPTRLTLKARKSDIDAAAAGKLATPEEFKAKVSLRIG
jgi:hypothetical protein